ncbi:fimbria/pilus outer membrane usher protein [Asaia bogorensis]|uniref:fimbria/pilus outer membrane usher protein n=1 Tax=Asaia bogorensis TaxID=91915 RepID=UPI0013CF2001|nr:fimbria/pilus outer membrane usher protein [Asaia bogorensis]
MLMLALCPKQARAALPPPPRATDLPSLLERMTLHLDVILNGRDTGHVVPVTMQQKRYAVSHATLRLLGLGMRITDHTPDPVDPTEIGALVVRYEPATQRLILDVPPQWLPRQILTRQGQRSPTKAQASLGAIVNYDAYATQAAHSDSLSLWSEQRLFGRFGTLSNTGVMQFGAAHGFFHGESDVTYHRYDTTWSYSDQKRVATAEAGDILTKALAWSNTMRLGGLQISRNFAIRPDIITYPLPQFSGQASVPTSIDLLINGVQTMHDNVQPGPYSLTNIPYINGAGEATVVTTDALGRRTESSIPFYVASTLLRPGFSDYTLSLGAQRRRYGLSDMDYGPLNLDASYRRGILPDLTLESHFEGSAHLALSGLGILARLGPQFGVVNLAGSVSHRPDNTGAFDEGRLPTNGHQLVVGYQYTHGRITLSAQKIWRSRGFADLSTYEPGLIRLPRRSLQANASLVLPHFGSFSAGYFDVAPAAGERTRFATLGDTLPLWRNVSLSLMANRYLGGQGSRESGWAGYAQIVIPFGTYGTASAGWSRQAEGSSLAQLSASRSVAPGGGFGWNANYQHASAADKISSPGSVQASLTWRNTVTQLQGGVYGPVNDTTRWAEAQGSLAVMDNTVFAGNRVSDAFAVISTDGIADVPVRYENQIVGRTGKDGHLLVPYAISYYPAKYEIDTLALSPDLQVPQVEQRVAIQYGSGYLVHFPVRRTRAALIHLNDEKGNPLPIGTRVEAGSRIIYVGWGGISYVPDLTGVRILKAYLSSGRTCMAEIRTLPAAVKGVRRLAPLVCRLAP